MNMFKCDKCNATFDEDAIRANLVPKPPVFMIRGAQITMVDGKEHLCACPECKFIHFFGFDPAPEPAPKPPLSVTRIGTGILYEDAKWKEEGSLSKIEILLDDSRNPEFSNMADIADNMEYGKQYRVTLILEEIPA